MYTPHIGNISKKIYYYCIFTIIIIFNIIMSSSKRCLLITLITFYIIISQIFILQLYAQYHAVYHYHISKQFLLNFKIKIEDNNFC